MRKIFLLAVLFYSTFSLYAQHTIVLKTGEKMSGEVKSINDSKLSFLFKGNAMTFSVSEIETIHFSEKPGSQGRGSENTSGMKGVSYALDGRKLTKPPVFENLTMKKGVVVVDIIVNKYGNVIKASPGSEGTTTSDAYLLDLGKKAAQSAGFDNCPKCPLEMKGTITVIF